MEDDFEERDRKERSRSIPAKALRLLRVHARLDFLWMTRDLRQFSLYYFADVVGCLGAVTSMLLLAERFDGIGNWSKYQMIFMLGYALLSEGILSIFFSYNVLYISRVIGRGQLDHLLIQPQPLWLSLCTQGFAPFAATAMLLPGIGLMAWAIERLGTPIAPGWLALLALHLIASATIILSYSYLWASLAFVAPRAAEEISTSALRLIGQLKTFPLDGLSAPFLGGMLSLLPAGFAAWKPSRFLLGIDSRPWSGAVTPLAAIAFGALAAWVFKKGLSHYAKTGSQRYLSFGFRR